MKESAKAGRIFSLLLENFKGMNSTNSLNCIRHWRCHCWVHEIFVENLLIADFSLKSFQSMMKSGFSGFCFINLLKKVTKVFADLSQTFIDSLKKQIKSALFAFRSQNMFLPRILCLHQRNCLVKRLIKIENVKIR